MFTDILTNISNRSFRPHHCCHSALFDPCDLPFFLRDLSKDPGTSERKFHLFDRVIRLRDFQIPVNSRLKSLLPEELLELFPLGMDPGRMVENICRF